MNPRDEFDEARRLQVNAYLDGELPPEEARDVLRWLEAHPKALRAAEEARRVESLLGLYADEPVPEAFAEKVLAEVGVGRAVDTDASARPVFLLLRGRSMRIAAIAAGALLAVGVGVLVASRGGGAPTPASATVAALEALPAELLENGDVAKLADLSDEDFDALVAGEPDDLAKQANGEGG